MLFDLKRYRNNIAFVDEEYQKISYGDIFSLANRIQAKIGTRKLIYLIAKNTLGALGYYVAFLYSGNIVQIVSDQLDHTVSGSYLKAFHSDYVCMPLNFSLMELEDMNQVDSYFDYVLLEYECSFDKMIHDELAVMLPTSGSTGECRFVMQSRENIYCNAKAIIEFLEITPHDRPILALPISYTYGLSVVHTHILAGATLFIAKSSIFQRSFWNFFMDNRVTSYSGVPHSYELLDKMKFYDMDLPSLNCLTQAGGKMSERLQAKFNHYAVTRHVRFYVMYGQTEATARMTYLPYQYAWRNAKIGSVGIPIPGTDICVVDNKGNVLTEPNREGEIVFQGKNVAFGYAEGYSDLSMDDENRGILNTGDIGYMDQDGFLYITGRKTRFVKVNGNRISLDSIEENLRQKFHNIDCAVTGNDSKVTVYIDKMYCYDVKRYLLEILSLHKKQLEVYYWEKIPRNVSGKISYRDIIHEDITRKQ